MKCAIEDIYADSADAASTRQNSMLSIFWIARLIVFFQACFLGNNLNLLLWGG
jgi:hypothetical protein